MQLGDCCKIAALAFLPTTKYLLSAVYLEKLHGACLQLLKCLPEVLFFLLVFFFFFNYHANTVVCTVKMIGIGSL